MLRALLDAPPIKYTNLLQNSDFSDGATGWTNAGSLTFSVSNGIATCTAAGNWASFIQTVANPSTYINHKMYGVIVVKADSTLISGGISVGDTIHGPSVKVSTLNQFVTLTMIGTIVSSASTNGISIGVSDTRSSGFTPFYVSKMMLVDLTATFGAGNEPTQIWCDANLPYTKTSNFCFR